MPLEVETVKTDKKKNSRGTKQGNNKDVTLNGDKKKSDIDSKKPAGN